MEGGRYNHSQEGQEYDTGNVNEPSEIVKMRRRLIVHLIDTGEITNPEAAIIIVEKLQRERSKMEQDLHKEASQQTEKEIYGTARKYW